jgi:hypothetical protein
VSSPRRAAAALALLMAACPAPAQAPGDTVLGTFAFTVSLRESGCAFADGGMPESFTGVLSIDSQSGEAFLTVGEASHEGTFDGERLVVKASAGRTLGPPCNCACAVTETIEARLYDEAQARAVGGCDGGIPVPPSSTETPARPDAGLDIRLVCGTVRDEFGGLAGPECACEPCAIDYGLAGRRQ